MNKIMTKRLASIALVVCMMCSQLAVFSYAQAPPVWQEEERIENKFRISIVDTSSAGVSVQQLKNLEKAIENVGANVWAAVCRAFEQSGKTMTIHYKDFPLVVSGAVGTADQANAEICFAVDKYRDGGADYNTAVHEIAHMINFAIDLNIGAGVKVSDGLAEYNNGYQYLGNNYFFAFKDYHLEKHFFANAYAMKNGYEDFASIVEAIICQPEEFSAKLADDKYANLLRKTEYIATLIADNLAMPENDLAAHVMATQEQEPMFDGSDWAVSRIKEAYDTGLLPKSLARNYQRAISRAEFCQLMYEMLSRVMVGDDFKKLQKAFTVGENKFTDTDNPYVVAIHEMGFINGRDGTIFDPDAPITRAELAKIGTVISKHIGIYETATERNRMLINDVPRDNWAYPYANYALHDYMIVDVLDFAYFEPTTKVARETAIIASLRMYKKYIDFANRGRLFDRVPEEKLPDWMYNY